MKRTLPPLADTLAVLLLLALCIFSITGFEQDWDTIAYHLPYAALRSGLMNAQDLSLSPGLQSRYDGFPGLVDLVQGGLWRLSGTPKAAALVTPLAIAALAVYARHALRLRLIWPVMIFLAVPILHTALQAAYVDLWTNAFFSLHLVAAFRSLGTSGRTNLTATIVSLLALAVAVNSKEQFYLVGGVSFALYGGLMLLRLGRQPATKREALRQIITALVLSPVVFASPIQDWIAFGNPIYPIDLPRLGWHGPEQVQFPASRTLDHAPRMVRYLLSQFELNGLSGRAHGYTIDQGESEASPGYHMGGSSGILLFAALAVTVPCLRRLRLTPVQKASAAAFALLTLFVANFPGGNELRYFSFVNITLLLATMAMLQHLAAGDGYFTGLQTGFRLTLLGSALFTAFITAFVHVIPHPKSIERVIEKRSEVRRELGAALAKSDTVCYSRFDPYGLYYAYIFNQNFAHRRYKLILDLDGKPCPAESAQIR